MIPRAELLADVTRALGASTAGDAGLRIGLEAELIPISSETGVRLGVDASPSGVPGTRVLLERAAERATGTVETGPQGVPYARLPGIGLLSYEPGGQLELSTEAFHAVDPLLDAMERALRPLARDAEEEGITLLARGMDADRDVRDVPFVVDSVRHRRQRAHYDRIGPWGSRMMVQSAALHLNLDLGGRAVRRWWAANRLAPILTALFANSPGTAGPEGPPVRSLRAEQWRHLDPSRTGLFEQTDAAGNDYLTFALGAADFLGAVEGVEVRPFRAAWEEGADLRHWRAHLTTLFPEVRPRGYLELRSVDGLRPAWYAAPLVVAVGLLYDPVALLHAGEALPRADAGLLARAGREGVRAEEVRCAALDAFDLALSGARALGPSVVGGASLERAEEFRRRFTAKAQDPGDEPPMADLFAL
jgi:glutamate--cysteine ligase